MYCPNCNSNLMDGTKKCPFCGTEFNNDPNSAPQQNYNSPQQNYNSPQSNYNMPQQNTFGYNNYNNYAPTNPPRVNFRSKPNTLGIIASLAILAATFMPFFSITLIITVSGSLFDGKDWILFIPVGILGLIFSAMKMNKAVITMGALSVALTIGEAVLASEQRLKSKMGEYWEEVSDYVELHYDYGFYVMIVASVLLLVAGIYGLKQNGSSSSY